MHALLLDRMAALAFEVSRARVSPKQENHYVMQNAGLGVVPYLHPIKVQNLHRGMPKLPFMPIGAAHYRQLTLVPNTGRLARLVQ